LTKGHLGRDKKLKAEIKTTERSKNEYFKTLRQNDLLLKESGGYIEAEEGEDLLRLRQKDLLPLVPIQNVNRAFDLDLIYGDYSIDYTRNGNFVAMAGSKGHIAVLDWKKKNLKTEFNVKDKIRDVKFLTNENMIAVAQKKYAYIYDGLGTELHRLKFHAEPLHLEYLPYHYLLVTLGKEGTLRYQDISTGEVVASHKTKVRESQVMIQNTYNGIILVGDNRGQATMWCPNTSTAVVQMLCHKGSVNAMGVDVSGKYMVTAGSDGQMKVWDVRTFKPVHEYWNPTPAKNISISQKGLLAVGWGSQIQVWKDWHAEKQKKPYLKYDTYNNKLLTDLQFTGYEDYLGVGLYDGFSSVLVPGSGEANFDSYEVNVFQSKNQRREDEVSKLLDKLPADSITLDPAIIGTIDKASRDVKESERKAEEEEAERRASLNKKRKLKMRGRSSTKEQFSQKESVYDDKTRSKIKAVLDNKLKMKRLEKKKAIEEQKMIENEDLLEFFDPVDSIKRLKK